MLMINNEVFLGNRHHVIIFVKFSTGLLKTSRNWQLQNKKFTLNINKYQPTAIVGH